MTEKKKYRLDVLLYKRGLAHSREEAQRLIMAGKILVEGELRDKPGVKISSNAEMEIKQARYRFVSRGGEKLVHVIETLAIDLNDKICADIGASTGGFTDCLLQQGAKTVYSIDVGKAQLHETLICDPRVIVMDRVNARYLAAGDLPEKIDVITIDVSFISLKKIIPPALGILAPGGIMIALAKPQFEAGREKVPRSGVVKDSKVHEAVIASLCEFIQAHECTVRDVIASPLPGAKGNQEYFIIFHQLGYESTQ